MFDTDQYAMRDGDTVAELLSEYRSAARATDEAVTAVDDLDKEVPLPEAPWAPGLVHWPIRRILLHLFRETAQHCGHADIIRESLDGATTTGQPLTKD